MSSKGEDSRDDRSRPSSPEIDFSVIRTAIQIGGKVIEQIMNGIHYGSDEVRNLLLEECDVILECKVCRNFFRSLPNFVAHKRVYCTNLYEEQKRKETEEPNIEPEDTVIIEPASPQETLSEVDKINLQKTDPKQTVIDKVIRRTFEGHSKSYDFYTKIAEEVEAKKISKSTNTVTLKSIPTNPNAVILNVNEVKLPYSAIETQSSENKSITRGHSDSKDTAGNVLNANKTKPTIGQLCEKLANRPVELQGSSQTQGSNYKPASIRPVRSRKSSPRKSVDNFIGMKDQTEKLNDKTSPLSVGTDTNTADNGTVALNEDEELGTDMATFVNDYSLDRSWLAHCDVKLLKCRTCDKSFTTPYGLKFHCKMKHVDKMVQYTCPTCKKSFTYFTALARHLRKVHTKSESYIELIQAKLKGKFGRRKSLDDEETDSNESSPESIKKNMLALDTGWKKCDKCGKICWKAKSYHRHYQHCKGLVDNANKSQNGEASPVKITEAKDKETGKRPTSKGTLNEKSDNVKEIPKFNENLTIRTRRQVENGLHQPSNKIQGTAVDSDISSTSVEIMKNQQNEVCINAKEKPYKKVIYSSQIEQKKSQIADANKEQRKTVNETAIDVSSKTRANKTVHDVPVSVAKVKKLAELAITTRKQVLDNRQSDQLVQPGSDTEISRKSLNAKSTAGSVVELQETSKKTNLNEMEGKTPVSKNKDKHKISEKSSSPVKKTVNKDAITINKEYKKPVTRRSDGTLPIKENKKDTSSKVELNVDTGKGIDIGVAKQNPRHELLERSHSSSYSGPVTRHADLQVSHDNEDISGKSFPNGAGIRHTSTDLDKQEQNADKLKNAAVDSSQSGNIAARRSSGVRISMEMLRSPERRSTDREVSVESTSSRGDLDSPTWSDNPMLKFKMTVKEMAELVESASLSKFARERKKKAKQILNKKQNGVSKAVSLRNTAKSLKGKAIKKKTVPAIKKVYGTRLSTGSKKGNATSSKVETEEKGHRYATRHTEVKIPDNSSSEVESSDDKKSKQIKNIELNKQVSRSAAGNKVDVVKSLDPNKVNSNEPHLNLEHATLNSKRKEYLAAKRDQRRKFLLANKSASPKKSSPEKLFQTRARLAKETSSGNAEIRKGISGSVNVKSLSPNKKDKSVIKVKETEKGQNIQNKKDPEMDKQRQSLRNIGHKIREAFEPTSKDEAYELRVDSKISAVQDQKDASRRFSDRIKAHSNELQNIKKAQLSPETKVAADKISDRTSRRSASHESPLQKNTISDLRSKSVSTERSKNNIEKGDRNIVSRRSRSSEIVQNPEISSINSAEKERLVLSDTEMTKQNTKSKDIANSTHSDIKECHISVTGIADKKNWSKLMGNNMKKMSEKSELPPEQVEDMHVKLTETKKNEPHSHQTRLSTGSIAQIKVVAKNMTKGESAKSSNDESSSGSSPNKIKSKNNKTRKRHLSAPQQDFFKHIYEPKRYSLSTGVIQCNRCEKTFWKKTSYNIHILKSPCGKKQKDEKNEKNTQSTNEPNKTAVDKQVSQNDTCITEFPEKLKESKKTDNVLSDGSKENTACEKRSYLKRALSTSPKYRDHSLQSDEDVHCHDNIKRPRLEQEKTIMGVEQEKPVTGIGGSRFRHFSDTLTTNTELQGVNGGNTLENQNFDNPTRVYSTDTRKDVGSKDLDGRSDIMENVDLIPRNSETINELPGTSKHFFDEDSDTDSEFSGFSEADLSFPQIPDEISDNNDSDDSLKSDTDENYDDSCYHGDESCVASDDFLEGDLAEMDKKELISVQEIWVDKEPGMPVVEKTKSNRIYVMDTDRSSKLYCQDKRNIDSFVDEGNLKCLRCDREFTSISNVRQHVIRHLGWKRYQCKMCSVFAYYNLSEARMHLSRSHSVHVESEADLKKYVKDLNKEAGKKRSNKRMKTIQKKKGLESPSKQGNKLFKTKRQPTKLVTKSVETSESDHLNLPDLATKIKSSQNRRQSDRGIFSPTVANERDKSFNRTPTSECDSGKIHNDKIIGNKQENGQNQTTETPKNGLEEVNQNSAVSLNQGTLVKTSNVSTLVKKSVRLAAKEETRKSAVEILKGPKLSPKKSEAYISRKTTERKSESPKKTEIPPSETTNIDISEESVLNKARQMLAMVLK